MKMSHVVTKWVAVVGLCGLAGTAFAQGGGRGGPRISPEDAAKVWGLQAASVASSLDLADDAKTKVADIYKKAREAQGEAMREAMAGGGGGDPSARFQAMRELNEKHAADLKTALTEAIGDEAGAKAAEKLAAFDRQSDSLALALTTLGLDEAKTNEAVGLIGTYASSVAKATEEAIANMDMEGMRNARRELRTVLDDGMAKVLDADQLAKWKEATAFRGGRGGRGGPGGGPGGGGGASEN